MEPRIQYARTSDGVSIAYWTLGEGEPMLMASVFPSHAQLMWESPEERRYIELLARGRRLVGYDSRGWGLSERAVSDYSLEALVLDLEAVVRQSGLERFTLYCAASSGPVGIAYAAGNADRLLNLILVSPWVGLPEWFQGTREQTVLSLLETDWELYTETIAHVVLGWERGEPAHRFAKFMRESTTPEAARALSQAYFSIDVTDALPRILTRTLVLHRRQAPLPPVESVMAVAARIPGAQLKLLEGTTSVPYLGDTEGPVAAIDEFLGASEAGRLPEPPSGTAVILFADIAESTALTEEMGDAAFREKARELDGALRAAIRECQGMPVEGKLLGDGVLAVFTSARQAIEAALRCGSAGDGGGLPLHLGIHAGDVIREENNVYGGAVNIAARIAAASAPGEVLVSDTVRGLARTSAGVSFEDRGEQTLKGVSEPHRLFAVRGGK